MKEKKIRVLVLQDGRVVLEDLPVKQGDEVEITVHVLPRSKPTRPLRGLPVRLTDPFLPAADESEWESSK